MSLKVLLALNNENIRQKIINYIDWIKMDLELVASLNNGSDAKKVLNIIKPDIVITEIKLIGIYSFLEVTPIYNTLVFIDEDMGEIEKAVKFGIYRVEKSPINLDSILINLSQIIENINIEKSHYKILNNKEIFQTIKLTTFTHDLLVLSAISFIQQNYNKNIGLQEAAALLKVTDAHLSRIFKAETGLNYVRYLNIYRINATIELMHKENLTLMKIASSCGFNTMSYFAKIFKRELGIIPSKYRELHILYYKK